MHDGPDVGTGRTDWVPARDPRDPWHDAFAAGWGELDGTGAPAFVAASRAAGQQRSTSAADIYLEVQRSEAFQEVRRRYRRFVFPAVAVFFAWYVAYVVTATAAPGLMARPVAGAVNVGLLAGLGQFLTTFLLTWAYARHARLRRDRPALDLRWTVFEQKQKRKRVEQQERRRGPSGSREQEVER
ncbi:DUF485 domain-containing protein [Streptomyces sp. NPDC018584]|uniref:DUF485 domain-containing protein n=1 Tax=unclassified Streptomyces TaxID=2593676 RepID=UPI0037882520